MSARLLRRFGVVLIASGVVLVGCQKTQVVGAVNRCDASLQVDVVRFAEEADTDPVWTLLEPGERDGVRTLSADAEQVYVIVRESKGAPEVTRTIPISRLRGAPAGADYAKEVELTDTLCPR